MTPKQIIIFSFLPLHTWRQFALVVGEKSKVKPQMQEEDLMSILNGDNCPIGCNEGFILGPKPGHLPYSNGCKMPNLEPLNGVYDDYSHFDQCCNLHDVCYMSCGATKKYCDDFFKDCMSKVCESYEPKNDCDKTAQEFGLSRTFHGCPHFRDSQEYLCLCYKPEEAHDRVSEYAHEFFKVYNKTHMLPDNVSRKYLKKKPNPALHGQLLFRLFKKYPESIEVVARDGITQIKFPKRFKTTDRVRNNEQDDNEL